MQKNHSKPVQRDERFDSFESSQRSKWVALATLAGCLSALPAARNFCIRLVCKLEGGMMWSRTYRRLMAQHYGVEIGRYSYGPALLPGRLPRGTRIGNYCSIAGGLHVLRRNHPVGRVSQHPFFFNAKTGLLDSDTIHANEENPLVVGHDVWIGHGVLIAPGCSQIGNSSVIASGSVVTRNVEPFAIVGGVPAKRIRYRVEEQIRRRLDETKWWDLKVDELSPLKGYFVRDLDEVGWEEFFAKCREQLAIRNRGETNDER